MYHALDLGISVAEFWGMTPRAICILLDEMRRGAKAAPRGSGKATGGAPRVVRLDYIPRP